MKTYLKNFNLTVNFIEEAILDCLDHKTGKCKRWFRRDTSYFLAEYFIKCGYAETDNIHEVAKFIHEDVRENIEMYKKLLIPDIAKELYNDIKGRCITLRPIHYQQRKDKSSGKLRDIGITSIKQQVLDYVAVAALKPLFNAKIGTYQCSSIKDRGQIYAKRNIEKALRGNIKKHRYASKFDVRKYYPSILHSVLFSFLESDVKNDDVLYLAKTLVGTYSSDGVGLCIGTYLSQYLANYFLSHAYHYINENAFKVRKTKKEGNKNVRYITKCFFYMDDILLLGSDKQNVRKGTNLMIKYMHDVLKLRLKHEQYQIIDLYNHGAFIDMVGYRFYKKHTTIRRRIYNRIKYENKLACKFGDNVSPAVAKSFMSHHGYVKYSDSRNLKRRLNYSNNYENCRKVVRKDAESNI